MALASVISMQQGLGCNGAGFCNICTTMALTSVISLQQDFGCNGAGFCNICTTLALTSVISMQQGFVSVPGTCTYSHAQIESNYSPECLISFILRNVNNHTLLFLLVPNQS
jgi:hypothetical protein